ncbi:MAG: hypothetical protein IPK60_06225 [Sandaracinaceae bacterium]|nr:hypothetical protein [Sandaracinaceae bacterium]
MKASLTVLSALLASCSLVLPASDHQGGSVDAGADDMGPRDSGADARVDAGAPECTGNAECDPSGLITCLAGRCVWCVTSPAVATGIPFGAHAREPLHTLIVPPDTSSHPARVLVSYATGDGPGDGPHLVRTDLENMHVGEGSGDVYDVLSAVPSATRTNYEALFGFAFRAQTSTTGDDQQVYWTAYAVRNAVLGDLGPRHSQLYAVGDFFSSAEHDVYQTDLALGLRYLAEPAITNEGDDARFVGRVLHMVGNNSLGAAARNGGSSRTSTDVRIPAGYAPMSAAGAFVAIGALGSTDVVLWNPDDGSAPESIITAGRSTRPALATSDGTNYYLAYGAGSTLYVRHAVCTRDVSSCNFEMFGRVETSATSLSALALQVLHGHPILVSREANASTDDVVVRMFREDGTLYPNVIDATAGGGETVAVDAIVVDTQSAAASTHADVDLAVADFDSLGPRVVVSYLRGEPSPATTPHLIGLARISSCQP